MTKEEKLIIKKAQQSEADKKWYNKNKEKKAKYNKEWNQKNKEKIINYHQNNKEKIKEKRKIYCENNKELLKERRKIYRENNIEKIKQINRLYHQNNKEKINLNIRNKRQNDSLYKLKRNLSSRMLKAFKKYNFSKSNSTLKMIGCDIKIAKLHLEKQFTKGMSWENHGEWHIDHIIPCASAKTEEELIKLFHYTNLQPLWAADNMSKGKKIIEKQLFLL